jgi:RNA polymerase sigma factor (sigma-70 family)
VALGRQEGESPDQHRDRLDTALMALWRDTGEEVAFEALYAHACDRVLLWLRWLGRGEGVGPDPSDLLQDTFVNVYRYGRGFRDDGPSSFRSWVRTIAGNALRRATTRGRPRHRGELSLEDLPDGHGEPADPGRGPHLRLVEGEERKALAEAWLLFLAHYVRAYAGLSPRDRRALRLVEVQGLSYAQTCARLGVSGSNMKMIMLRARRRLHKRMRADMQFETAARAEGCAPGRLANVG